jgi:hypothetical protein
MNETIRNIREFFWPMLDPMEPENTQQVADISRVEDIEIHIEEHNLKVAFDLKIKLTDNEEERRKGVEGKAALLLSSISLATSLVVGANSLIGGERFSICKIFLNAISFVLCLYTVMTVWYSMKCLERGKFLVISFDDINVNGNSSAYYKGLLKRLNENFKKNHQTVNVKVDSMVMAQEFYKRSIVVICIYAFMVLILGFFK